MVHQLCLEDKYKRIVMSENSGISVDCLERRWSEPSHEGIAAIRKYSELIKARRSLGENEPLALVNIECIAYEYFNYKKHYNNCLGEKDKNYNDQNICS